MPAGIWRASLVPSIFNTLGQLLFGLAPYYVDPGLMTFSLRLQIVFVTVGAALLFPAERRIVRTPMFLAGLAIVFLGTMGTIAFKPGGLGGGTSIGIIMSVGSGLLYACYSLAVRHYMQGMNPLVAFAAISQYTAIGLLIPMFIYGRDHGMHALDLSASLFALLVLSSLIGIGLGHTFYYISIARLGVAVSAGVIQLQPFLVAAASFFMFNERLTIAQWSSGAAAVLGAGIILSAQHRMSRADKKAREAVLCAICGSELSGAAEGACPDCGSPRPAAA
jgi:drug/metabolite transporter (DMT)-like permease